MMSEPGKVVTKHVLLLVFVLLICAVPIWGQSFFRALLAEPDPVAAGGSGNSITFRGVGQTNNASNDATTTANTTNPPTANALVLALVANEGAGSEEIPTLTGHGMEWILVATTNIATTSRLSLFRAMTNGSPTSDAVVAAFGGATQTACLIRVVQFSGVDTSGTSGSGAIAQSMMNQNTSANPDITLASLSSAANAVYAGFLDANTFAASPETDWLEDWEVTADTLGGYATVRVGTTDNTVVVTATSSTWQGIAVEVKVAP